MYNDYSKLQLSILKALVQYLANELNETEELMYTTGKPSNVPIYIYLPRILKYNFIGVEHAIGQSIATHYRYLLNS